MRTKEREELAGKESGGGRAEEGAAKFSALEGKVAGNTIRVAPSLVDELEWSARRRRWLGCINSIK